MNTVHAIFQGKSKLLNILMAALLFGFGWHIRGDGTSDVTVAALLLMLFIGATFPERRKFNFVVFAMLVFAFLVMRTGWGTFVAQAGIPGLYEGHLVSKKEGFDIIVPWWQGYFWLFIVGISWAGFPSLFLGGYFFTEKKYSLLDLLIYIVIFAVSDYVGEILAEHIVPLLSPTAYNDVYLAGISKRNYVSMIDNFATAFALFPVLIFIWFQKRDWNFIKHTLIVTAFFAIALSVADVWQAIANNNPEWKLPGWNLWEYFTGFIFGGLLFAYYHFMPSDIWQKTDVSGFIETKYFKKLGYFKFPILILIYFFLVLYGISKSIIETVYKTCDSFQIDRIDTSIYVLSTVLLVFVILFFLYRKGKVGQTFAKKSFQEKSLILLIALVPFYYICLITRYVLTGTFLAFEMSQLLIWIDTISVIIFEVYAIIWWKQIRKEIAYEKLVSK